MDRSCHIAQAVVVPLVTNEAAMVPVRLLLQSEKPSEVLPNFLNLVSYGTLQHAESIPVLCAQVWYCWCVCVCVFVCVCVCGGGGGLWGGVGVGGGVFVGVGGGVGGGCLCVCLCVRVGSAANAFES